MHALVKAKPSEGLWLEDVPEPEVGINDVLIRVHKTGICGTDLHIYRWDAWAQETVPVPMTVGHEFVGVVADVGSNVTDFAVGDLVSGEGHVVCGRCRNCMAGRRHLCAHSIGLGVQRPGELGCIGAQEKQTADQFVVILSLNSDGKTTLELEDARHGPIIQNFSFESTVARDGKHPVIVENKALRRIEERQGAAGFVIEGIDRFFKAGRPVQRLAPGISSLQLKSMREALFQAGLKRVVGGGGDGVFGEDVGEDGNAVSGAAVAGPTGNRIAVR